jgi:nucleotide-binding universal stress UspA family protein
MSTLTQVARISLKNILVPTDFSVASDSSVPFAQALAQIYGSTVLVTHVLPAEPHRQVVLDRLPVQDDRTWHDARRRLDEFARRFSTEGTRCQKLVNRGDIAEVIPAIVAEQEVDLIVLGTHGRRGMSKVVLGSGAEKIYRSAPCPVLTVGPGALAQNWAPLRILFPVDLTSTSKAALNFALSLAEENAAEFIALAAVPIVPWQHRAAVEEDTLRAMESFIPAQAKDWCTPHLLVRWEYPAEAILHVAAERETDLIVMGVHRTRTAGLSSHKPWPIASEVVSRAPCPVLTVRV